MTLETFACHAGINVQTRDSGTDCGVECSGPTHANCWNTLVYNERSNYAGDFSGHEAEMKALRRLSGLGDLHGLPQPIRTTIRKV